MKERSGDTVITSVSISKEFANILKEFNISPTNALRKGIAVEMCERGVLKYSSPLNKERLVYVNKFLDDIKRNEAKTDLLKELTINTSALLKLLELVKEDIKV